VEERKMIDVNFGHFMKRLHPRTYCTRADFGRKVQLSDRERK
jgi:hypothetical protein